MRMRTYAYAPCATAYSYSSYHLQLPHTRHQPLINVAHAILLPLLHHCLKQHGHMLHSTYLYLQSTDYRRSIHLFLLLPSSFLSLNFSHSHARYSLPWRPQPGRWSRLPLPGLSMFSGLSLSLAPPHVPKGGLNARCSMPARAPLI